MVLWKEPPWAQAAAAPRVPSRRRWLTRPNGEIYSQHMANRRAPAPYSNVKDDTFEMDRIFPSGNYPRSFFRCSKAMG
jgi:hypothetical protein